MTIRVPIDGEMGFENRSGRISYWFSFRSMSLEHFSLDIYQFLGEFSGSIFSRRADDLMFFQWHFGSTSWLL